MKPERTDHGIKWGSAEIECFFDDDDKKWVTWGLKTPKYQGNKAIQIYVTKTGKVRVFDWNGEWTPPKRKE